MSVIALVGSVTLLLSQATLDRIIMPLVAFAAGSLLGGLEVNKHADVRSKFLHFVSFIVEIALLWVIRLALE